MMWLNRTLKILSYIGVRIMSALSLAFLALMVTSPFFCLAVSIMDITAFPSFIRGRLFYAWLAVSLPFFIGFFIHTEIKLAGRRREINDSLKKKEQ